jgi:hypothetical protein
MMRPLLVLSTRMLAIAVAALAGPPAAALPSAAQAAADERTESIEWTLSGERGQPDKVQLSIESRWSANSRSMWSNDRSLSEFAGFAPAQLAAARGHVRFALVREAGRLDCSGTAGFFRGGGACSFTPDARFAAYLQARGIGAPTRHQAFTLTMSGVGRDLVDALDKGGFERPDVEQLAAMGIHGATADYVKALSGLGYRLTAADVVAFKIHGVDPDYIRALAPIAPKLRHITPSDLVSLRIHGVEPQFVRAMAAIGPQFADVTADDLVNMAIHGVKPELAASFVRFEGGQLHSDEMVSMAIHGVTADYVEQIAALGYRNLTADDFVNMAIHGVTPDYVRSLRRSGMALISAAQLVRLRLSGFDPDVR